MEIIGTDALPVDDIRYFTVEVRRAWEVLVVHAPDVTPYNLTDLLAPIQEQERGSVVYQPTVIRQEELGQHDLADFDGVFFLDPDPLPEAIWEDLARYVTNGGGVAFFLGHNAATSGGVPDPAFQSDAAARLLTGKLVRQWNRQTPDRSCNHFRKSRKPFPGRTIRCTSSGRLNRMGKMKPCPRKPFYHTATGCRQFGRARSVGAASWS